MKTQKQSLLHTTVDYLRDKVSKNLHTINENIAAVRALAHNMNMDKDEKTHIIMVCNNENKSLLAENNDLIHLQYTLTNYMHKYGDALSTPVSPSGTKNDKKDAMKNTTLSSTVNEPEAVVVEITEEECWKKTLSGEIPYNEEHPCYGDDEFFNKLLSHYQQKEEYEKCSALMNLKSEV